MSRQPVTYGRSRPKPTPSSSLIFDLTPPTSPLLTPHASSDDHIDALPILSSATSGKENISPTKNNLKSIPTQSTLSDFFNLPNKKRPFQSTPSSSEKHVKKPRENGYRQMHLTHLPLLHTCSQCQMSYVRGGDDEGTHERHHARVTRGIIWDGLGRGKRAAKARFGSESAVKDHGWRVIRENVAFAERAKGRILVADGSYGGAKLDDILRTIDTVLSSPPLPTAILERCKIFLFTTTSPPPGRLQPTKGAPKERVVSVVVSQPIKWAMRVLSPTEKAVGGSVVDSGEGVLCESTSLPTPLGIHRLFTIPTYRSLGLAQLLLDAACEYTIPGSLFDPKKGEVAFSQPTNSGRITMEKWGKGEVRIFVDDESQL